MKIFNYLILIFAVLLVGYNAFRIDFSNPFQGESTVAIIGIVAAICAVLLLALLHFSKIISDKTK